MYLDYEYDVQYGGCLGVTTTVLKRTHNTGMAGRMSSQLRQESYKLFFSVFGFGRGSICFVVVVYNSGMQVTVAKLGTGLARDKDPPEVVVVTLPAASSLYRQRVHSGGRTEHNFTRRYYESQQRTRMWICGSRPTLLQPSRTSKLQRGAEDECFKLLSYLLARATVCSAATAAQTFSRYGTIPLAVRRREEIMV